MKHPSISIDLLCFDFERVVWFYRLLGFELARDLRMGDGTRKVILTFGTFRLYLRHPSPDQRVRVGAQAGDDLFLSLDVEGVRARYEQLGELGVDRVYLHDPPYGVFGCVRDPVGNKVLLRELFAEE